MQDDRGTAGGAGPTEEEMAARAGEAVDVTPGWVSRHRERIEAGRRLSIAAMTLAPPPARIALAAVSVAASGVLLADDMRRRRVAQGDGALEAGALALEGAALLAVSRFAPGRLARNLAGIEAARAGLSRLRRRPG